MHLFHILSSIAFHTTVACLLKHDMNEDRREGKMKINSSVNEKAAFTTQ